MQWSSLRVPGQRANCRAEPSGSRSVDPIFQASRRLGQDDPSLDLCHGESPLVSALPSQEDQLLPRSPSFHPPRQGSSQGAHAGAELPGTVLAVVT